MPLDKGKGKAEGAKARCRSKKGVPVNRRKEESGTRREAEEMSLDLARLKPMKSPELRFGFVCFRTVTYTEDSHGSRKSHFYFIPVHHLLSGFSISRLFPSSFLRCSPAEIFRKRSASGPIYGSPEVPQQLCSEKATAVFRFPYIYLFGSCVKHTTDAFALNLLAINMGWQKLRPMSYPKRAPKAITIGDQIYVFSSCWPLTPEDATTSFVDVYDTVHHYWRSVDPGNSISRVDPLVVPLRDCKTNRDYVLLHDSFTPQLCVYGLSEQSLALLPERPVHVKKQPALLNGVLYCYIPQERGYYDDKLVPLGDVVAYNLNGDDPNSWWTPIPVMGLLEHLSTSPVDDVHLLAIENESILCLLSSWDRYRCSYYDKSWATARDMRLVECSFFKMYIHNTDHHPVQISAHHLHTTQLTVPGSTSMVDCLVV